MNVFHERLVERRNKLGMTQGQLAAALEIAPSTLANMERGLAAPSARLLDVLCRVMETRPDYLMGWSNVFKSKVVPSESPFAPVRGTKAEV